MKNKTRLVVLTLLLFSMTSSTVVLADSATNEAITGLSVKFEESGTDTLVTITIELNDNAMNNDGLLVDIYLNGLGSSSAALTLGNETAVLSSSKLSVTGTWDVYNYPSGMHTMYAVLREDTLEESQYDNKDDNMIWLLFGTQQSTFVQLIDLYGMIQYSVSTTVRSAFNGTFSFIDALPVYGWILVLIIGIVIVFLVLRARKKGKLRRPSFNQPYHYAQNSYQNFRRY